MSEPKPRQYFIRLQDLDKPLSDLHPTYPMVHYYEWFDAQARADALDAEVKAMWKENYELRTGRAYSIEDVIIFVAGAVSLTLIIVGIALSI